MMKKLKLAPGATPGFPLVREAVTARLAFGRLAEAASAKEAVMVEADPKIRAALLAAVLVELTAAASELMPLLADASARAVRDAQRGNTTEKP